MPAKKTVLSGLAVVVVAALAAKLFWPSASADDAEVVQTVSTVRVQKQNFPVLLETTGNTVAVRVVDVRPQVTNVVSHVHIREGQRVKKGDLLFSLDDRADRANYDKALAASQDAQRQYQRARELVKQNFIAQSAVDTAQSNADAASAAARAAQVALGYDSIRSPIDGRIGILNVFEGALVQPGTTVTTTTTATATTTQGAMATITQLDPINLQFTIPETMLPAFFGALRRGEKLSVEFELGGKKRQGRIYVIDNQVDAAIGAVRAKAEVDNPDHDLIPGQFVRLSAMAGELKDALVVPSQAVVMSPAGEQMYVVGADSRVALQPVKVQMQSRGMAVVSGLREGDRVVVEGKQNLRPGTQVREAAAQPKPDAPADAAQGASAPAAVASTASAAASAP